MRENGSPGDLRLRAIAGTHVVLMAWDLAEDKRDGLLGFAIQRQVGNSAPTWLSGLKYFKSLVPNPVKGAMYSSEQHPFQTFLWSDYECSPKTKYTFTVIALFGSPGSPEQRFKSEVTIFTEPENDGRHGVWFNRGAVASHALSAQFQNRQVTDAIANEVDAQGVISDKEAKWLSRGLAEACIQYINGAAKGEGLRVCAYEFTYPPILDALLRAHNREVDVQIVYHYTKKDDDANLAAINKAGLPEKILFQRTRTAIPHNKFIVKLQGNKPRQVWTGSTNFTSTGFLGQTNVGHLVTDDTVAETYLEYWKQLSGDPVHSQAVQNAVHLTPNPPEAIPDKSIALFYSPRIAQNMLTWYAARIADGASFAAMTIPFNVAPEILAGLSKPLDSMRMVILENEPTPEVLQAQKASKGKLLFSNGTLVGKQFIRNPRGGAKIIPIPHSLVDEWFIDEELARPVNGGHVYFMHAKTLVIDALSDDPLVCSGSANFSTNSLIANDENMLLIRGEPRVADIYLTEFDRIFRHFFARAAINQLAQAGNQDNPLQLDETQAWIQGYFKGYKNNRRLLFFPDPDSPSTPWSVAAAKDSPAFANEDELAAKNRQKRSRSAASGKTQPIPVAKRPSVAKTGVAKKKTAAKKKAIPNQKVAPKKKATPKKKVASKKAVAPKKGAAPKKKTAPRKTTRAKKTTHTKPKKKSRR